MFTGIIETTGEIISVTRKGSNRLFTVSSSISSELKIDQSVSHNGVCLTVIGVEGNNHQVEAVDETLTRTNLGKWKKGTLVNLERSMLANARVDGHFVQGHVDDASKIISIENKNGSWLFTFSLSEKNKWLVVEKGSIAINGVSLTIAKLKKKKLAVAVIPYTYEHTNFSSLKKGDAVNIEFDIIGKYISRQLKQRN